MTLVEILLVMVLITLLTGGGIVAIQGRTGEGALRAAAVELESALRFASSLARAHGAATRLVFGPGRDRFLVESYDHRSQKFVPCAGIAGRFRRLPQGVIVHRIENDSITFDPSQEFSSGGVSELRGGSNRSVVLTVLSITGDIHVQEVSPR